MFRHLDWLLLMSVATTRTTHTHTRAHLYASLARQRWRTSCAVVWPSRMATKPVKDWTSARSHCSDARLLSCIDFQKRLRAVCAHVSALTCNLTTAFRAHLSQIHCESTVESESCSLEGHIERLDVVHVHTPALKLDQIDGSSKLTSQENGLFILISLQVLFYNIMFS